MENNICRVASITSSLFERTNTDLKRKYLIQNIILYNLITSKIRDNHGTFGTGYPFYALKPDLTGDLPVIDEQIRYNDALLIDLDRCGYSEWPCESCLMENYSSLPDLKIKCKPCKIVDNSLKPRKVLNRLPDIDLWMIYKDVDRCKIQEKLSELFYQYQLYPSDIDPVKTIEDLSEIAYELDSGAMPNKMLPLDSHVMDYETMFSLIEQTPEVIKKALEIGEIPYLPIHPFSLRKKWQQDDTPYNFIHDYLYSFTDFNFDSNLKELLDYTRKIIANSYSNDELFELATKTGNESVIRRNKTRALRPCFDERINLWRK